MKFSKVLSLVLTLVMLFCIPSFAAYSDVPPDADYAEAVSVLSALEILSGYEDGSFRPDSKITRAEYAAIICRIIGLGDAGVNKVGGYFTDIPYDHWASGYIATASAAGIVNGMGDGTFAPSADVTYEQAVKMLVCALGYERQASQLGGWPDGYLLIAERENILSNTTKTPGGISRATVAKLTYNALTVPMMDQISWGENPAFAVVPTRSLLWTKLFAVKTEATVTFLSSSAVIFCDSTVDGVAQANGYALPAVGAIKLAPSADVQGIKAGDKVLAIIDNSDDTNLKVLCMLPKGKTNVAVPSVGSSSFYNNSVIPTYESITGAIRSANSLSFNQSNAKLTRYFYSSNEAQRDAYVEYLIDAGWVKNGTETVGDSRGTGEGIGFSHKDSDGNTDAQVVIYYYPDCGDVDILCVVRRSN